MECLGVIIAWIAKWFKSSKYKYHRFIGFIFTVFVASYWCIFLSCKGLWWLALYNFVNILLALRGIRNNRRIKV